jgi:Cu+-exporting ATPase
MSTSIDLVCGMTVAPETAAAEYKYNGRTYYFCAVGCKERFAADPEKYLKKEPAVIHSIGRTVKHGDVTATPAGEITDPVCGMKVSPETAAGKYDYKGETYYFCSTGCLRITFVLIVARLNLRTTRIDTFQRRSGHNRTNPQSNIPVRCIRR